MTSAAAQVAEPYPPFARAWTLVVIFAMASVIAALDRGVLNLVVDPVRHDLQISDVQISLLQGLSFGIFYATVGVPLGLLADRVHRLRLITAGVLIWSLATVMGGLAPNYEWMFASRLLVGLGEATLGPCAVSMISDMLALTKRGRPISVYLLGQAVSGGLSVMLVGFILVQAPLGLFDFVPAARGAAPWRVAFVVAGLSGIVVAALFLTQREPKRRGLVVTADRGLGIRQTIGYLSANKAVFVPFYFGFSMFSLASYSILAWTAVMLMRQFELPAGIVSRDLGIATIMAGATGPLLAGLIIDHQARRGRRSAKLSMLMILSLCALPASFATFAPDSITALLMLSLMVLILPMVGTAMLCGVQEMVPNNMRGVAVALFGLLNTFLGAAAGPLLVALVTEHVFKDAKLVGHSILVVAAPAMLVASALYLAGYLAMRKSLARESGLRTVMNAERV